MRALHPIWLAAVVAGGLGPSLARPLAAQIKLHPIEDPKVGREAPDLTAPYVTAAGPGPVDQPFHLRAELGRTVVLLFATSPSATEMQRQWEALEAARDSVLPAGVVAVGLIMSSPEATRALAATLGPGLKFLPDTTGRLFRTYGVVGRASREHWAVFVVNDEGRLVYRSREFLPSDSEELSRLRDALQ